MSQKTSSEWIHLALSLKVCVTYSKVKVNLSQSPTRPGRHSTDVHDFLDYNGMQMHCPSCHCHIQPHVWQFCPLGTFSLTNMVQKGLSVAHL